MAGEVAAARYVEGVMMRCQVPRTPLRRDGDANAIASSELLYGEDFEVFDTVADWAFGRCCGDLYVGWVAAAALAVPGETPRKHVTARVAPVFSAPDIKAPLLAELPFAARVDGEASEKFLALSGGGFLHNRHVAPLQAEPIAVARLFAGTPYVWGGRTGEGIDCSGLVQAALLACGIDCARDSDQQRDMLGCQVAFEQRRPGDLIFFPGHVGFLTDGDRLFHANAHWMSTVEEPLADVIARLRDAGVAQPVSGVRRLTSA